MRYKGQGKLNLSFEGVLGSQPSTVDCQMSIVFYLARALYRSSIDAHILNEVQLKSKSDWNYDMKLY